MLIVGLSGSVEAFADDMEEDFWFPFTHFHLGSRASAGYVSGFARSGTRSFHVAIWGWALRDFGSAYGYALYSTQGSALTELRVSLLYESLRDDEPSAFDAFLAGISLDLLDSRYRNLGTYRYVTAYRPSDVAWRCTPTAQDWILGREVPQGGWIDVARNPAVDFAAAPWGSASFVKVSIGFLCAAGLTGASYSMFFDDFFLETDSGDSDGDGLRDLDEESRLYTVAFDATEVPLPILSDAPAVATIDSPFVSGPISSAAVAFEVSHPSPSDLSVTLSTFNGSSWATHLLWDPGFHARGIALLSPEEGDAVHGTVNVQGGIAAEVRGLSVNLYVDGDWVAAVGRPEGEDFSIPWSTEGWSEGPHTIQVTASDPRDPRGRPVSSEPVEVVIDNTPPEVRFSNLDSSTALRGLAVLVAQAYDSVGVALVELSVDGAIVEVRTEEPYAFVYDTLDVSNGVHLFEVRARDLAGNTASADIPLTVSNVVSTVIRPCLPSCNLTSGTTVGNLEPWPTESHDLRILLGSGDALRASTALRVPWRPGVSLTPSGAVIVAGLSSARAGPGDSGLLLPGLDPEGLASVSRWNITVTDHGPRGSGILQSASVLVAARTSPSSADTDGDGILDGLERVLGRTVPILRDSDHDLLPDGQELIPLDWVFLIDGDPVPRTVLTDPADPDVDRDDLIDGLELQPGGNESPTDPTDPDTDDDTLWDEAERSVHRSDPTRRDTDSDTLPDPYEVMPRELALVVNGTAVTWTYTTAAYAADTDGEGLNDSDEEQGRNADGIVTHPAMSDTDEDGLTDYEELQLGVDGFLTSPLDSDTEGDGVWDVFDKLPREEAQVEWATSYPVGLVRFTQEFLVFSIQGTQAVVWQRDDGTGDCSIVSNDVEASTKSSVVNEETVVASINKMFEDGGENRYRAVVSGPGDPNWTATMYHSELFGECGPDPKVFYIEYEINREAYQVSFTNVENVTIADDLGAPFSYALLPLHIDPGESFSIVLQFSLPPGHDRIRYEDAVNYVLPAFSYLVYAGPEPTTAAVIHSGLAIATDLNEHAYRVELRIPGDALDPAVIGLRDGIPTITLYFGPQWIDVLSGNPVQRAMNVTGLRVASLSRERVSSAYSLIVRLNSTKQEELVAEADRLALLPTGVHEVAGSRVYVFQHTDGVPFNKELLNSSDAVLIVAPTDFDVFAARDSIDWGSPGVWHQVHQDGFGKALRSFRDSVKIVRSAVSVVRFLELLTYRYASPGEYLLRGAGENLIILEKRVQDGAPIYAISEAEAVNEYLFELSPTGWPVVRQQRVYRVTTTEFTTDPGQSTLFKGRYTTVLASLRGLSAGAILATNGYEAIIAFRDGNVVKGIAFSTYGTLGVLSVFRGEYQLAQVLPMRNQRLGSLKVGPIATVAAGGLLAGTEFYEGLQSSSELVRRSHFERSVAYGIDTAVAVIPGYGGIIVTAWGFTNLGLSLIMPNRIAARITSSPGTTIVFLFEYFFSGAIPSEIAKEVLENTIQITILMAQDHNAVVGKPAVPVLP